MARYLAPMALLPGGWAQDVTLEVDGTGVLQRVQVGASHADAEVDARLPGIVVPGVVNAHSHAFQRALAGGAEFRTGTRDSFWSWRDQMYRFLGVLTPEDVEAIATQLYLELLQQGYTRVVEFHYLHNDPSGAPYADRAEISRRLARAAERVGLGITLLPVLYRSADFGGVPPEAGQRRFVLPPDAYLGLVDVIRGWASPLVSPGFAFHSLRAVSPGDIHGVLDALDGTLPRHIHVAEQPREVEACLGWSGKRPVEWLLDHTAVGTSWSLVHCTHMTADEARRLARSGATAVVCPTTEANLGDGLFGLQRHLESEGSLAIGSDSHVSRSPVEELRWLEYGQRLVHGVRAASASPRFPSAGRALLEAVWQGGARAAGVSAGTLTPGSRADLVVLDPEHPSLVGRSGDQLLDAWIFSGNDAPVREVWVAGRRQVADGRHNLAEETARSFAAVMDRLLRDA